MPIRARIVLLLACALAATTSASARGAVTLVADAGLGAVARPGRWTPVRVTVESASDAVAGDLILDWGSARVRRAVAVTASARWQGELYIRADEVRETIRVRFVAEGRELAAADVPIRVARPDESFTLCVGSAPALGAACTATMAPSALPRSWRGYDAADNVIWPDGDASTLSPGQRDALEAWRAIRPVDDAGNLTRPSRDPEPTGAPRQAGAAGLVLYLAALTGVSLILRRRAAGVYARYGVMLAMVATGSALSLALGRVGPASAVVVSHSTVLEEFVGTSRTLVSMRGLVEFPSSGRYALRPTISDAAIDRPPATDAPVEQRFDAAGFPILAGVFGLGARQAFSMTGLADLVILRATKQGGTTRLSNASPFELNDCRVTSAAAASEDAIGTLHPGDRADIASADDAGDPTIACAVPDAVIAFVEPAHTVQTRGTVRLIFHLAPPPAAMSSRP